MKYALCHDFVLTKPTIWEHKLFIYVDSVCQHFIWPSDDILCSLPSNSWNIILTFLCNTIRILTCLEMFVPIFSDNTVLLAYDWLKVDFSALYKVLQTSLNVIQFNPLIVNEKKNDLNFVYWNRYSL